MAIEIRDMIHGDVVLSPEEIRILDTFEMQRLRHVPQLGNVSLVYPSAVHTRFEHSLGARWMAQKIVRLSRLTLTPEEERVLYLAALLHDIAVPCVPHLPERLRERGYPTHERIARYVLNGEYEIKLRELYPEEFETEPTFVSRILDKSTANAVADIICPENGNVPNRILKELVNGAIDADTLDYLERDARTCGLPYCVYDDRIFASYRIAPVEGINRIVFKRSPDTINAIFSVLNARFYLRAAAYQQHAVVIADEMFLSAVQNAISDEIIDPLDLYMLGRDELYAKILFSQERINSSKLKDQSRKCRDLIRRLKQRRLFKRSYVLSWAEIKKVQTKVDSMRKESGIDKLDDFRNKVAAESGIPSDDILVSFPIESGWKPEYSEICLVNNNREVERLELVMPNDFALLETKFRQLETFTVAIKATDYATRERVNVACGRYFAHESKFRPQRSIEEEYALTEKSMVKLAAAIQKNEGARRVISVLIRNGRPSTREDIAKSLGVMPTTASYYLSQLSKLSAQSEPNIVLVTREGRKKFWQIRTEVAGLKDLTGYG